MTHTKGPWIFRDCTPDITDGKYTGLRYEIWASTLDYHIANTTDGAQQAEANARLIAAAPDLFYQLKTAIHLLKQCGEFRGGANIKLMEEAVNKAKGVI